mmetsp:Transcript_52460/g.130525  ORF Transcript_52460/g.130525 Transcript_52460/m.130525 type:complete len:85 (-) Transcript_52460:57-311(-)|eukprot:CAMPEP_0173421274 /NCGR_PEP_ID=MMETSP1357-20121228/2449_1 /TAXON_ID=77926 /ORGANISM="Hemiselmis rufescens, Strain PCC563" /LENGTH=84 /DNA_ID=CAMNT_0014384173 /DNA_START=349 /DNA_END=603 /DNA_ORIENTATION=-
MNAGRSTAVKPFESKAWDDAAGSKVREKDSRCSHCKSMVSELDRLLSLRQRSILSHFLAGEALQSEVSEGGSAAVVQPPMLQYR